MQKHTQIYYDHFDLDESDVPECEISGEMAVDIHHIYSRGMGGKKTFTHEGVTYDINHIFNLMALSRTEHEIAEDRGHKKYLYWDIHQQILINYAS